MSKNICIFIWEIWVYIKFADANGLESPVYSDSITVNGNWQTPLTLPSSGARTNDTTPTFTWTADALAATYGLVISKNADLSTPDLTVTAIAAATYTLTAGQALPVSAGQLYYWSVRPVDAIGVAGSYATASNFTLDTTAPTVSSKTPAAAAASVATTSLVSAVFGEALDANSLASGTFTVATTTGSVQKTGVITYDSATNTVTFTPSGGLTGTTPYTASLTTAIKDVAGNALAALYSWNFTTAAGWAHPSAVSDKIGNTNLWNPTYDVAMNEAGDIAVAYLGQDNGVTCAGPCNRIYVATFKGSTRTWTYPATQTSADYFGVGAYHASNPKVAINTAGHMLLTWEQSNSTNNQVYEAECFVANCQLVANWTKPAGIGNHISPAGNAVGSGTAAVALDDASDKAVIAWVQGYDIPVQFGSAVYSSFRSGGVWAHPLITDQIDAGTGYCYGPVSVAFKGGKGLVAWVGWVTTNVVYTSMYNGAAWTNPVLANKMSVDVALKYATAPQVAMSANGTGILVWNQTDGTNTHVFANTWKGVSAYDGTGWGTAAPVAITAFINPAIGDGNTPKVAMDGAGKATVVWRQKDDSILCNYQGCDSVFKSTYDGATWTNPTGITDNISLNGQNAGNPSVAMDAAGNGLITWTQYDGSRTWIYKSELRGGTWTNPSAASDGFGVTIPNFSGVGYSSPALPIPQMGNSGEAIVIWSQSDGTNGCMMFTGCNQVFKSEYR